MLKAKQAELLARGEDIRAQTDLVPLVYEIFASAEAFPQQEVFPNSGVQFYQARYFLLSESQAEPAIRIRDLSVDPNPFEPSPVAPEDRQVATISAYVDAVGFDGGYVVVEPRIYDQSGNLVRRFEDQYPIDYFELEWDGYDDEGNRVEPQEITIQLSAHVCDFAGLAREIAAKLSPEILAQGCSLPSDAFLVAQVGTPLNGVIQVRSGTNLVAQSFHGTPSSADLARLRTVFPDGRNGVNNTLEISASGFTGNPPSSIEIVLEGSASSTSSAPMILNQANNYTTSFTLTPGLIRTGQLGPSITFSDSVLSVTGGAQLLFEGSLMGSGVPYPGPDPTSLGTYKDGSSASEAENTASNVSSLGYETVEIRGTAVHFQALQGLR